MQVNIKKNKYRYLTYFVCIAITLTNFFSMIYPTEASASNVYYVDDYEPSSVYAAVEEKDSFHTKKQTVDVETKSFQTETYNGKAKNIYNTIIIKSKKPSQNNGGKTYSQPQQDTDQFIEIDSNTKPDKVQPEQQYLQPRQQVNNKTTTKQKQSTGKKPTILEKITYYLDPFSRTKPDAFYIYALFGYNMTFPYKISANAVWSENEQQNSNYNSIKTTSEKTIGGWAFNSGIKTYLNRNTFAFFVSPEVFYHRLQVNQLNYTYHTSQQGTIYSTLPEDFISATEGYRYYDYNFAVPAYITIQPTSLFGGSLRFGFTIANFLSFYIKGNIGGLKNKINGNIDFDNFSVVVDTEKNNTGASQRLTNALIANWNSLNIETNFSTKKISLIYGAGAGIELAFWNQHFVIRCEYDQFFGSNVISLPEQFGRYNQEDGEITPENIDAKIQISKTGNKWKIKNNFGILKVSVGLAF